MIELFGRNAPLHVDLGCGDGSFVCALAAQMPDANFLGIDRMLGRVNATARKAVSLDNVRVLRFESSYAVRYLLPASSVEKFYLLFPDPWPKRRHQRRRVMTGEFLDAIAAALVAQGTFHIATDQRDYFDYIAKVARASSRFRIEERERGDLPFTTFENRFLKEGVPIYRVELRKIDGR